MRIIDLLDILPEKWVMTLSVLSDSMNTKPMSGVPEFNGVFLQEMSGHFIEGELTLENAREILMRDDFPKNLEPVRAKLFEILA